MGIIKKIKNKIAENKLRKDIRCSYSETVVCNLNDAKSIGIIYEVVNEDDFKLIKNFTQQLKSININVLTLGYADIKELESFHIQPKEHRFFCRKDVNWYGKPNFDAIEDFVKPRYDILIDLQLTECLPLKFVTAISQAGFKIGRKPLTEPNCYDLMLELKPYSSLSFFIEQVTVYLKMINK